MTPGPTEVPYEVMAAMLRPETNSDLDPEFLSFYNDLRSRAARLFGASRSRVYLMIGEAMLGLEAAVANLVSRGDRVIVVDNGVYGDSFADLVRWYGGGPGQAGGQLEEGCRPGPAREGHREEQGSRCRHRRALRHPLSPPQQPGGGGQGGQVLRASRHS